MKRLLHPETIYAMATIGRNENPNFMLAVNPDSGRKGDCYFKYYNAKTYDKADKVARISFTEPRRIIHRNVDVKIEWTLTTRDRKELCKFLDNLSSGQRKIGATNWHMALYLWNLENNLIGDYPDEYLSDIDAFIHGFYDGKCDDANYLPSTLIRPDYTKLD